MSLIGLIIIIALVGFICWAISAAPIPMHPWFKHVIIGLIIVATLIYLLQGFGVDTGLHFGHHHD